MTGTTADLHNPLRHACDRCHLQKLRCPRSDASDKSRANEACSRCRKAGVPCVVSVRGKVGRPCKVVKKKPPHGALSTPPPTADVRFTPGDDADAAGPGVGTGACEMEQPWESSPGDSLAATLVMEPGSLDNTGGLKGMVGIDTGLVSSASYDPHSSGFGHSAVSPPISGTTSYDSFCLNVDDHVDFTSMFLPPNMTSTMASSKFTNHLGATDSHGDSWMSTAERATNDAKYLDEALRDAERSEANTSPAPSFCSTTCYGRLLELNVRILTCMTSSGSPEGVNHQIQRDVVGFSGELIEAARESLPHLVGASFPSSVSSTSAQTDGRASSCDDAEGSTDSDAGFEYSGMDKRGHLATHSWGQPVPKSAVIFLLVGCYTQILHLLELTINHLSDRFHDTSQHDAGHGNTPSASFVMGASLTVHTVTYLLGRLHNGFVPPRPRGGNAQTSIAAESVSEHQSWERIFMGHNESDDGLLGRAFDEMRKREQLLVTKMDHLRQMIGEFDS
ncbi:hypothetical protein QIS74_08670 [Colletotrichum tabaci]|uniref:Zn(2)-C6 fungal-type domain-containing protein n=1 Tax=Colletotrichum tabaci TaxID=1209068 RepID=A0AAV9T8B6_9PEZI